MTRFAKVLQQHRERLGLGGATGIQKSNDNTLVTKVPKKNKAKGKNKKNVQQKKKGGPSVAKKPPENVVVLSAERQSDEPPLKRTKWTNRQRVLVFSSRGITPTGRHLMNDLKAMMPHAKTDVKMDRKDQLQVINEVCEMKNCNKCIFFEIKKKRDVYLWLSNIGVGPSVKFLIENIHTMLELKMTGNCLKGSRPFLSFDTAFDTEPHWKLLKEMFTQTFSTPYHHPRSQPFFDHVFTFSIMDGRVWFRNYQIMEEDASLVEIGPRFVLNPIRIFKGSFGGPTLYVNKDYVSPNVRRRMLKRHLSYKYRDRMEARGFYDERRGQQSYDLDPTDDIFDTNTSSLSAKKKKKGKGAQNMDESEW